MTGPRRILEFYYSDQLSTWAATYPSIPSPTTNRTHCIVWSDYTTQAQVQLNHGIRLDTNYYYWPPSWLANRPGFFTGSGVPMRFTALDGTMLDIYQATTQMTDESGQAYPFTIDTLPDKALGPEGYYGAFTVNAHTDFVDSMSPTPSSPRRRLAACPSSPRDRCWSGSTAATVRRLTHWPGATRSASFTITVGASANGLQVMVLTTAVGVLASITRNGTPIAYTTQTIKGIAYAFFPAGSGAYQARYQ